MEYIPPIFSVNTEEFCRCLLISLVVVIIPGVLCVTVVLEVCTSFYVFREIVELSPMDVSWDYKMSNDVDGRQNVCLLIRRILLESLTCVKVQDLLMVRLARCTGGGNVCTRDLTLSTQVWRQGRFVEED